jgi:hypothetical protein
MHINQSRDIAAGDRGAEISECKKNMNEKI